MFRALCKGNAVAYGHAMQGCPGALNVEGPAAPDVSRVSPAEVTEETQLLQGWKVSSGLTVRRSTALGHSLRTLLHSTNVLQMKCKALVRRCVLFQVGDGALSLAEVHASVKVPAVGSQWYKKAAAFAGLGGMIAVGYMDPGNW